MPRKTSEKKVTLPKTLGACADMLYKLRDQRYALRAQIEELEEQESAIKDHLIKNLPKSQSKGISGKVANVKVESRDEPVVQDWDKFYANLKKKGEFDLLNRALNKRAVKERWEDGKTVPGVGTFKVTTVSVTKL
jgi:hypothetical protein